MNPDGLPPRGGGRAPRPGFVYLFHHGSAYKIGVSVHPDVRLYEAAAGGEVIHVVPSLAPYRIERALHKHFAPRRVRGEWFSLSPDDVALIRSLPRADSVNDLPDALRSRCLPRVCLSAEVPAGLARAFARIAGALGMSEGELLAAVLRAHLGEYERLAEELRRRGGGVRGGHPLRVRACNSFASATHHSIRATMPRAALRAFSFS